MFSLLKTTVLFLVFTSCNLFATGQRKYSSQSVLAGGSWYKISVREGGIHQLTVSFLNSLGINGSIPSGQIRLFGRPVSVLPENNAAPYVDDLQELALQVQDGGDGALNGQDLVLFYTAGPHRWAYDSASQQFTYQKNIYSDVSYYYLTIGGTGKRVISLPAAPSGSLTITSFDERWHHELDTVNFLNSGKEWFGEEFSNLPGRTLARSFTLPHSGLVPGAAQLVSNIAGRSSGSASRFEARLNNTPVQQIQVPAVGTGLYDVFARQVQQSDAASLTAENATITWTFQPGSFNGQGWLNWFEFFCRRSLLVPASQQLSFRNRGNAAAPVNWQIGNATANTRVWHISDPMNPVQMEGVLAGSQFVFSGQGGAINEYIAFSGGYLQPQAAGRVTNQNLHQASEANYFLVSYPPFLEQARRLAAFHEQKSGLKTVVVSTDQVYNEFSAGIPDPSAIRDFVKMHYDKYAATWAGGPRYLLLFGKGTFDYRNRAGSNLQRVVPYESSNSLDPLTTYTSDDFFGFLDDHENINDALVQNLLDIGIGRVPAANIEEARAFVDKVEAYHSAAAFGPWRNRMNFIADDEDNNLHLQDAELLTNAVKTVAPVFDLTKTYLDAFPQQTTVAGGRYPQVAETINNQVSDGTLVWNYSGHGGPTRLAEEVILEPGSISKWNNAHRLPLLITATCDFAPYDRPGNPSLGEYLLLRPVTGAIALMTTTRTVFAFSNRVINNNLLQAALKKDSAGNFPTLGQALMAAKNHTYQTFGDLVNNRKFTLLGDPALQLAIPRLKVMPRSINGNSIDAAADTLSAAEDVTLEGVVTDAQNNPMTGFRGVVHLSLFDKEQTITTLGNDAGSQPVGFRAQQTLLFKGKASAESGRFTFRFKIPRDISYLPGRGKISLYAQDGATDGHGFSDSVLIGGSTNSVQNDRDGPSIKAFLNDDRFVNGGITHPSPVLLVQLEDSSGINISGSIDHDIIATLDNDNSKYYVLNNYYESQLDDFQKGSIRFQLPELPAGMHTLKIKAWDVLNNSAEQVLEFLVVHSEDLVLDRVMNYPNPFTTQTAFCFEHNQPGLPLQVQVSIYTVSGKLVKTIRQAINSMGNRSCEVTWDGRDEYGNKIGRGVYIYKLLISSPGKKATRLEKLVLIN